MGKGFENLFIRGRPKHFHHVWPKRAHTDQKVLDSSTLHKIFWPVGSFSWYVGHGRIKKDVKSTDLRYMNN